LERSKVALQKGQKETDYESVRTSYQAWLSDNEAPVVKKLTATLKNIVGNTDTEAFQILRYDKGQRYLAHHDYFDTRYYPDVKNQRFASFFVYLTDTPAGGATNFPFAGGKNPSMSVNYSRCDSGLSVYPRKGNAVLWYNLFPNKSLDPASLHAGCSVQEGLKWAATKWFSIYTG